MSTVSSEWVHESHWIKNKKLGAPRFWSKQRILVECKSSAVLHIFTDNIMQLILSQSALENLPELWELSVKSGSI